MGADDAELARMRAALSNDEADVASGDAIYPRQSVMSTPVGRVRPDGTMTRGWGLGLICLGVILGLVAVLMPVTRYSWSTDIDPDKVGTKALLGLAGQGAFGLGLVLWLAGYIVHAISFLPGRED